MQPLSLADMQTIASVGDRWADDDSCQEYASQILYRAHGSSLPCHLPRHNAYFPAFIRTRPDERYVDCGAYTGDTLALFLAWTSNTFDHYHAIEPDFQSFRKLKAYIATLTDRVANRIEALSVAVSHINGTVPFIAVGTEMSRIATVNNVPDQCGLVESYTLDRLFSSGPPPTHIKMDIEGAELDAITGGSVVIRLHSPVLTICTYHQLDHLWLVPDLIHSINPDYKFVLRRYGPGHWETVCYALPPDRLDTNHLQSKTVRSQCQS